MSAFVFFCFFLLFALSSVLFLRCNIGGYGISPAPGLVLGNKHLALLMLLVSAYLIHSFISFISLPCPFPPFCVFLSMCVAFMFCPGSLFSRLGCFPLGILMSFLRSLLSLSRIFFLPYVNAVVFFCLFLLPLQVLFLVFLFVFSAVPSWRRCSLLATFLAHFFPTVYIFS